MAEFYPRRAVFDLFTGNGPGDRCLSKLPPLASKRIALAPRGNFYTRIFPH